MGFNSGFKGLNTPKFRRLTRIHLQGAGSTAAGAWNWPFNAFWCRG